jgi:inosine-uridine nucleoside N-ribohydrolase
MLHVVVSTLLLFVCREVFKFHDGAPLHDPCAVAAVVAPELFEVR